MLIRRWTRIIPVALLVLVIISSGVFTGCGKKTVLPPIFSAIDDQILQSAGAQYQALRASLSPEAARVSLVNNLNSREGVAKAHLGIDRYTIFIDYKDGDSAAVVTQEYDEEPASGISYSPNSGWANGLNMCASPISFAANLLDLAKDHFTGNPATPGPGIPITATSKKVLILSPISDLKGPQACQEFFLQNGWNPADITFKMSTGHSPNTIPAEDKGITITSQTTTVTTATEGSDYGINPGALLVKPEDFFNMGEYGVIIINAHGSYDNNFNEDNIFLQCGQITKEALKSNDDYVRWKKAGKLKIAWCSETVISGDAYHVLIRGDLLREQMSTLASPYVEMATCWGYTFNSIFIDKGAQRFLSWDNTVFNQEADSNQANMIEHMVGGKSVEEAYQADNITTQYSVTMGIFGTTYDDKGLEIVTSTPSTTDKPINPVVKYNLRSYTPGTSFYLPAWINLKVTVSSQFASLKPGTYGIDAYVLDNNSKNVAAAVVGLTPGQTEAELILGDKRNPTDNYLLPGHYKISVGGNSTEYPAVLSAGNIDVDLHCGANNIQIQLTDLKWTHPDADGPPGWVGGEIPPPITTPTTTPTTAPTTAPTTTPTTTTTTTQPIPPPPTSLPLSKVTVWLTTTNDSTAPHVSALKAGSTSTLYIWAQGPVGETGDFELWATLQDGSKFQLGPTFHSTDGKVINGGKWTGGFLNKVGTLTVNVISVKKTVGSMQFTISQ